MLKKLPDFTFSHDAVKIINKEAAFNGYFQVMRYDIQHRLFTGGSTETFSREVFTRGPAIGVLPYDPNLDAVVMLEQFRIGAMDDPRSPWLLEIVAGMIDPGETPEASVQREALEEADLTITSLLPICRYWCSPGASSEAMILFCGKVDASQAGGVYGLAEENEDINTHVITRQAAVDGIKNGQINNAPSIIALQWLALNHQSLRNDWPID